MPPSSPSPWSSVLLTGLSSLYNSSELSDVCLIAESDDDSSTNESEADDVEGADGASNSSRSVRRFPAHRVVLAAATPYFRALFAPRPDGAALAAAGAGASIRLRSVTPEALDIVLRFVYTGDFRFEPSMAQAVYEAAALLQLDSLLDRLRRGMTGCIGSENCVPLYLLADAHGDQQLREAAYAFMRSDARQLADLGALDEAPDWLIERLLADECLRVQCESEALYTLIRWTAADPLNRLRTARDNLRRHIRYSLVSAAPSTPSALACLACLEVDKDLASLLEAPIGPTGAGSLSSLASAPRLGNRGRLLYLGGRGGRSWRDDADLTSADSLDTWTGRWQAMPPLPSRRCLFAASIAADESVLIAGGEADGLLLDDCWLMSLGCGGGAWQPGPALPGPRAEHCLVRLAGHQGYGGPVAWPMLVLLGGLGQSHESAVLCLRGPDFATGQLQQISTLPACRRGGSAAASHQFDAGCIDFLGGLDAFDQPCRSWHRYDAAADHWRRMPDLPIGLAHFGLVASPADKSLYCLGGSASQGAPSSGSPSTACWRFVTNAGGAGGWQSLPPMPTPRQRLSAAAIGLDIFVVGGESRPFMDRGTEVEPAVLATTVDVFDVRAAKWRQLDSVDEDEDGEENSSIGDEARLLPQPRTDACLLAVPYV